MPILKYKGKEPQIDPTSWIAPNAVLIGDVQVKANSVVWPGCILRAEQAPIIIGKRTTIFDGVMMFTRSKENPIQIGNYNIIETGSCLFGTFLEDYVVIGENCVLYEKTSIGEGAVLLPESVISSGMIVSERAIMKGDPASNVREQSRNDVLKEKERAEHFAEMFIRMRNQLPNLQSYALTENDLMRLLVDNIRGKSQN